MTNIITFIRKNKLVSLSDIKIYDCSIKTKSIHTGLVKLFTKYFDKLNKKQLTEFLKWINIQFNILPPTSNVEINMSKIRVLIRNKYGRGSDMYNNAQKYLKFDPVQKSKNIENYNNKVLHRNRNCKKIDMDMVNKILKYKDSNNILEKIMYLLINSGSRFTELFNSNFKKGEDGNIEVSNIAKTRDKNRVIVKPLLDKDPDRFLYILNNIRSLNEDTYLGYLNKYMKNMMGESSYFLRKVYANVSYHKYADKKDSKTTYLQQILGHDLANQTTALCYQGYYVE